MNLDEKRIVNLYQDGNSLKQIGREIGISPAKVRKILITAGEWQNELTNAIVKLHDAGYNAAQIAEVAGLSVKGVNNYLPYSKGQYKDDNATINALRIRKHRERKKNT